MELVAARAAEPKPIDKSIEPINNCGTRLNFIQQNRVIRGYAERILFDGKPSFQSYRHLHVELPANKASRCFVLPAEPLATVQLSEFRARLKISVRGRLLEPVAG